MDFTHKRRLHEWVATACTPTVWTETRSGFNLGLLSQTQSRELKSIMPETNNGLYHIQLILYSTLLLPIWKEYNLELCRTHNTFNVRLRNAYNLSIAEKHEEAKQMRIAVKKKERKTVGTNQKTIDGFFREHVHD